MILLHSSFRVEPRCNWSSTEGLAINCKFICVSYAGCSVHLLFAYFHSHDQRANLIPQGIDQLRPALGVQMQKPNLQTQNQFLLASQQQQVLAQAQAPSSLGNSSNFGDMDPRRLNQLPRGSLNTKDGHSTRNDGSICSPVQSSSPKV